MRTLKVGEGMDVIIVGGGRVGTSLAQSLLGAGNEVLVIERLQVKTHRVKEQLGRAVINADGCEAATLAASGADRADVIIAATEQDEDNLVICQVARHRFHIRKVVARINQPRNERLFYVLGFQETVNAVELLIGGML